MFGILPGTVLTPYVGVSGGSGLSPRLWSRMVGAAMSPDGNSRRILAGDDFLSFGPSMAVAANVGYYASGGNLYKTYEETGSTVAQIATEVGGVITLTVDADDNQENWIQSGASAGVLGKISDTAGDDRLMIFETRFKTSAVVGNLFVGLSEEGLAAADTITDAGAMASKDFIGFCALEDAPTTLKFIYRKAGQAMQTVATAGTIAADTYYKVGFVYDPKADASKRITAYFNNVDIGTYVTATNIAAATFPDGEELAFLAGHKNVTDITALSLDWWAFAQDLS